MSAVVEAISDVADAVFDVVEDVADFVIEGIIEPVVDVVGGVIESAISDPLGTIASIAAVATGNAWALPLIQGANTIIQGGDLGDALEAMAKTWVAAQVGQTVGKAVGSAGTALEYGTEFGSQQTAVLYEQSGGWASTMETASQIIGAGAGSAASAVVMGRDPMAAFLNGGIAAAVPAVMGAISEKTGGALTSISPSASKVISQIVTAQLSGGNVSQALISSLVTSSSYVTNAIREVGGDLPPEAQAVVADVLTNSVYSAISGSDPSKILPSAIQKATNRALVSMNTDTFKNAVKSVSDAYSAAQNSSMKIDENLAAQKDVVAQHEALRTQYNGEVTEQTRLKAEADAAVAAYNASPSQATADAANAAIKAFNTYATNLQSKFDSTYNPQFTALSGQLDTLKAEYVALNGTFEEQMDYFTNTSSALQTALGPAIENSAKELLTEVRPDFDPELYQAAAGLTGDQVNSLYSHALTTGLANNTPMNKYDYMRDEAAVVVTAADGSGDRVVITNTNQEDAEAAAIVAAKEAQEQLAAFFSFATKSGVDISSPTGYAMFGGDSTGGIQAKGDSGFRIFSLGGQIFVKNVAMSPDEVGSTFTVLGLGDVNVVDAPLELQDPLTGMKITLAPSTATPLKQLITYAQKNDAFYKPTQAEINYVTPIVEQIDAAKEELKAAGGASGSATEPTAGEVKDYVDAQRNLAGAVYNLNNWNTTAPEQIEKIISDYVAGGGSASLLTSKLTSESMQGGLTSTATNVITAIASNDPTKVTTAVSQFNTEAGVNNLRKELGGVESRVNAKMAEYESAGIARDAAHTKALEDVAKELGTTKTDLIKRIGEAETAFTQGLTDVKTTIGTRGAAATQADVDAINNIIGGGAGYDATYDFNSDGKIDAADKAGVEALIAGTGTGVAGAGSKWGSTGLYGEVAKTDAANAARIAATRTALSTQLAKNAQLAQRQGNFGVLMNLLGQAQDTGGQQVTVKAADPAKIGYIYDWNSIFANPSQQAMFVSPYGKPNAPSLAPAPVPMQQRPAGFAFASGGMVNDDDDDVTNELIKIIRG